jgi:LysM repeat protein
MSKMPVFLLLLAIGVGLAACQPAETSATASPTASLLPLPVASATQKLEVPRDVTPGAEAIGPTPTPFVHIIQQGETMLGIALRYGVSLEDLILVNPGVDPGFLTIGESLRIPGEEGEAVDTLLPTPTPVPVNLGPIECYSSPSGTLTCLLECQNDDIDPIRGLTVLVRLFDRAGEEIGLQLANAPLELLLPGQSLPLSAYFSEAPPDFRYAEASILAAIRVQEVEENVLLAGENLEWEVEGIGTRLVKLDGSLDLENISVNAGDIVRIVGRAYAEDGRLTGYQILDIELPEGASSLRLFHIEIFSLGPAIDAVDLVAEVGH